MSATSQPAATCLREIFRMLPLGSHADDADTLLAKTPADRGLFGRSAVVKLEWEGRAGVEVRRVEVDSERQAFDKPALAKSRFLRVPPLTAVQQATGVTLLRDRRGGIYGKLVSRGSERLEVYYQDGLVVEKVYMTLAG